jgi:hypothetical protein
MLALDLLLFCLLANCCASLPVIFGYHSPHTKSDHHQLVDCNPTPKNQQNDLFVASVNQAMQRKSKLGLPIILNLLGPMALKDNAITYNENTDRSNYIPIEFDSQQEELPADQDFHSSYRRLVTRTVKATPHVQYPLEESPVFEYHTTETTTEAPTTTTETGHKVEECFENSSQLPRATIKKMNKRRRKLAQSIRRLNKLQRTYCLTATKRPKQKVQA